jgi:hypothetical protein
MKKSSIVDLPRRKDQKDLFGIEKYQEALVEFIKESNTPITIALQGEWGSGKTSLMNILEDELCNKGNFHRVWINSWQYSLMKSPEESILKIVEGIIEQILKTISDNDGKNETLKKMKGIFKKISISGGKFLAKQVVDKVGGNTDYVDDFFAGDGADGAEISQMKNEIQQLIFDVLQKGDKEGFIFFIDDLDRIDPPIAVQILELLKNIFDLDNCIFVLAIDYDVVIKGLEPKFGKLTEKNEREFRSFFDKIIQMPFSMPVASYTVNVFLIDALKNIGYISEETANDDKYTQSLSEFATLSVGQNPRALKRLTNTLSLINIINKKRNENLVDNPNEKLVGFAMVCLQIAYPLVYNKLLQDADFSEWNDETAIRLRLEKLSPEQLERLNNTTEFDDEWEKVLFQICQKETYSSNRVFQISTLLNNVKDLVPKDKEIGQYLSVILEQSAVTNLQANDTPPVLKTSRADVQNSLKDSINNRLPSKLKEPLINKIQIQQKGENARIEIRTGVLDNQLTKFWMHPIFILVSNKNEKTYLAINFACRRSPDDISKYLKARENYYANTLNQMNDLCVRYFENSFEIKEETSTAPQIVYQIKSTIEINEDINSDKMQSKLIDFIADWALLTVDFSSKIGFSDK